MKPLFYNFREIIMENQEKDYHDPFLGDKYFEEDLTALVDDNIKEILDRMYDPDSVKNKIQDIKRGIKIYLGRTDRHSKQQLKDDFVQLSGKDKAIWLFLAMGRCFYS